MKKRFVLAAALALSLSLITGCGAKESAKEAVKEAPAVIEIAEDMKESTAEEAAGSLLLSVNPEIAVFYDRDGLVTDVEGRNRDGRDILEHYTGYEGKETRQVVRELVTAIGEAGYFVEDIDGEKRQITIEIETGSRIPHDDFLDEVVDDVQECVNSHSWNSPAEPAGETRHAQPRYDDTDYGPNNDGVTDYGPNNDGVTDYADTDYGPNNDGVTDYADTDYGPNNDGVTDYADTDYGPNNDGVTDYSYTDYDDGDTNYDDGGDDTDYGDDDTDYGDDD